MRTIKTYSLSYFQICTIVLLITSIVLFIISPCFIVVLIRISPMSEVEHPFTYLQGICVFFSVTDLFVITVYFLWDCGYFSCQLKAFFCTVRELIHCDIFSLNVECFLPLVPFALLQKFVGWFFFFFFWQLNFYFLCSFVSHLDIQKGYLNSRLYFFEILMYFGLCFAPLIRLSNQGPILCCSYYYYYNFRCFTV